MNDRLEHALTALAQGDRAKGLAALIDAVTLAVQRGEIAGAEATLRKALAIAPGEPVLLARLAGLARLRGDGATALRAALAALAGDPGEPVAAALAVDLLTDQGACSRAVAIGEACLARAPRSPHVLRAMSQALLFQGRAVAALHAARAAADALGDNLTALSTACITSLYDDTQTAAAVAALHCDYGARIRGVVAAQPTASPDPHPLPSPGGRGGVIVGLRPTSHSIEAREGRRIRIGFASADLRAHPVGYFIESVLTHLDRDHYDVFCYARLAAPDALTARLRALPLAWRETAALDDTQTLAAMRDDSLDILVDLSGHTMGGRPRVLAARAAPAQILYLGYPYSSGIANIDFVLGDDAVLPAGCEPLYSEAPLRLPRGFLCLAPPPDAPAVAPLPCGADAPFTFASYNNLAKLSDATIALWAEVLDAVPGSRLALCALALADAGTRALTMQRFAQHQIDPRRLVLLPPRTPLAEFLRYYDHVDLALDPLPFNGGTTTVQALWQGVPTITLPGTLLQQRMGLSILRAAGLEQAFVARDAAHYVVLAREWSTNRAELASLRAGMRERLRNTTLFDGARFTRGFEDVLQQLCN